MVSATRVFSGVGGAPRIVAIIPLSEDVSARAVAAGFAEAIDTPTVYMPELGVWKLRCVHPDTTMRYTI